MLSVHSAHYVMIEIYPPEAISAQRSAPAPTLLHTPKCPSPQFYFDRSNLQLKSLYYRAEAEAAGVQISKLVLVSEPSARQSACIPLMVNSGNAHNINSHL